MTLVFISCFLPTLPKQTFELFPLDCSHNEIDGTTQFKAEGLLSMQKRGVNK
jgi:hypothetical protein